MQPGTHQGGANDAAVAFALVAPAGCHLARRVPFWTACLSTGAFAGRAAFPRLQWALGWGFAAESLPWVLKHRNGRGGSRDAWRDVPWPVLAGWLCSSALQPPTSSIAQWHLGAGSGAARGMLMHDGCCGRHRDGVSAPLISIPSPPLEELWFLARLPVRCQGQSSCPPRLVLPFFFLFLKISLIFNGRQKNF